MRKREKKITEHWAEKQSHMSNAVSQEDEFVSQLFESRELGLCDKTYKILLDQWSLGGMEGA